ncbi:MAG: PAS domain S-box protein [Deltaproteobacteria bacterium]|nr:PAS domain S-box protein [Deltaproteobacteria bacterium]
MASAVRVRPTEKVRGERRHKQRTSDLGKMPCHQSTDSPIEATPEDLKQIRTQLSEIKRMLARVFGDAYDGGRVSRQARRRAADLIEENFDKIVEQWTSAVEQMLRPASEQLLMDMTPLQKAAHAKQRLNRENMANALIRFIGHLRDPEDLHTYVYLRRHCQEGMLARARPWEFNIFHIALKQVILGYVWRQRQTRLMHVVRDTVVAAIDERRLMVDGFYIESRERALKESEEKYRNSIDHAPDPMYEIDPETLVILAANSAAMAFEHDVPFIGQPLTNFVPPEMRDHVLKHLRDVIERGSDQVLDWPMDGKFLDVNSALISSGKRKSIQMILHDVTQRHEMLDSLLKAERLAAAGTFASGVAHEVNNPLASISSLVQSLLPGETDPERLTALRTILSQITRIATTLKDLVNFARPAPPERKPLDLNEMVSETLRLIAYNRRFDGIRIEPLLAPDLKKPYADHNGIQQVLLNLLFNAADAIQNGDGVIRVITENARTQQGDGRVLMRVVDNGCGIEPDNLERVFDPFFTSKPAGAGVGLGLSLCQSIVLTNQGTIRVESKVGHGTTVTICLPVRSEKSLHENSTVAQ